MRSYFVFDNTGTCSVSSISSEEHRIRHCVSSQLHLQNFEVIGSGQNPVHAHIWEGTIGNLLTRMETSSYDCTPISTTSYGTTAEGNTISKTLLYSNYTQYQLSGPNVFEIPKACLKTAQPVGK
ncbi:uncharacterized protein LOC132734487 [Ruditapes philippinarum]|uniref:uncharacterized protein LOC132734487 n=1 Tax=Ruditapes philippinarum TaxID=129788 RepID=UPI00295AB975|nr:uncharacterized protein LOC132734487 [Ruditapes philippinarum]